MALFDDHSLICVSPISVPPWFAQVTLPAGNTLCGWGKAKFREPTTQKPLDENELAFEVTVDTPGVLDNTFGLVGDFLSEAKISKPNIWPRYATTRVRSSQMAP